MSVPRIFRAGDAVRYVDPNGEPSELYRGMVLGYDAALHVVVVWRTADTELYVSRHVEMQLKIHKYNKPAGETINSVVHNVYTATSSPKEEKAQDSRAVRYAVRYVVVDNDPPYEYIFEVRQEAIDKAMDVTEETGNAVDVIECYLVGRTRPRSSSDFIEGGVVE